MQVFTFWLRFPGQPDQGELVFARGQERAGFTAARDAHQQAQEYAQQDGRNANFTSTDFGTVVDEDKGKAAAGALGLGAYAMRNKLPSMEGLKEKAKGLTKKGAGSAAYGYAGTKGLGQATKALASLTGAGETGKALTQETGELAGNAIMYAIRKHGLPKIMKTVTKKLGYKVAAKTLGKLALGGIGAAGTGGVGAGLAALWTAKDIKDIYDIVTKMK